jgi:hypothetical protein
VASTNTHDAGHKKKEQIRSISSHPKHPRSRFL